jgi:hypothetical protein
VGTGLGPVLPTTQALAAAAMIPGASANSRVRWFLVLFVCVSLVGLAEAQQPQSPQPSQSPAAVATTGTAATPSSSAQHVLPTPYVPKGNVPATAQKPASPPVKTGEADETGDQEQTPPPASASTISAPQNLAPAPPPTSSARQTATGWAGNIYAQIVGAGIDPANVYQIRDAAIDREDIHVTIDDGVIGFIQAVDGRITGAIFEGDAEVLIIPPDRVERWSVGQFTGSAILEERFKNAFFRFNDDVFEELQPYLRPTDETATFVAKWDPVAHSLGYYGALRVLNTYVDSARKRPDGTTEFVRDPKDRMFLARVAGRHLGVFDFYYDTKAPEQITVGALALRAGTWYYDVWTSFPSRSARRAVAEMKGRQTRSATLTTQTGAEASPPDPVRINQYKLVCEVMPPHELQVDARLDVSVSEGGHRFLVFELSRALKVSEIDADGKPVEFIQNQALQGTALERQGNDMVAVVLPKALDAGAHVQLDLKYAGDVLAEAGGGLMYVGAKGFWYPNRGPAMSNFDMTFRYPSGWSLLATGKRVGDIDKLPAAPGMEPLLTSHWVSERPIPLAGFNLGQYVKATAKAGDVLVESYAAHEMESNFKRRQTVLVLPSIRPDLQGRETVVISDAPTPASNAQMVASQGARSIEFLSRRLGPYPYSSLALTQMPGTLSQGWPGLIFLSSYVYLTADERAALRLPTAANLTVGHVMTPHEIAHEWWGDLLVWKSYREQWLVEALSNYCAVSMLEKESPADFRTMMDFYRDQLLAKNSAGQLLADAGPVTLGARLISANFPDAYETISYGRGTWLFHMLHEMLLNPGSARGTGQSPAPTQASSAQAKADGPDDPFFRVLRKVRDKYEGKEITTRDLQQAFEEELPPSLWYEGHKSLDWFFDTWVNGMSVPKFELADVRLNSKTGKFVATGKIIEKDATEGLVTSMPVYAAGVGDNSLLGRVWVDGPEVTFRFVVPPGTKKILLDPYHTVLQRP